MIKTMREKMGPVVIGVIVGAISLVFIASDFLSGGNTDGLGGTNSVASVNGKNISYSEFNQRYTSAVENIKQQTGGKITDEQLKMFRIRESVIREMIQEKLAFQEAERLNLKPGKRELAFAIQNLPYFQKDGKFDLVLYKQLLDSNRLSPGAFEKQYSEQMATQNFRQLFQFIAKASDAEALKSFRESKEAVSFRYIFLDRDVLASTGEISTEAVEAALKDPAQLEVLKKNYEAKKDSEYKTKKFDEVKNLLAREVLFQKEKEKSNGRLKEIQAEILAAGPIPASGKASGKLAEVLKKHKLEIFDESKLSASRTFLPKIGEVRKMVSGWLAAVTPSKDTQVEEVQSGIVLAKVLSIESGKEAKPTDEELEATRRRISSERGQAMMMGLMKSLEDKAKIHQNAQILQEEGEA